MLRPKNCLITNKERINVSLIVNQLKSLEGEIIIARSLSSG